MSIADVLGRPLLVEPAFVTRVRLRARRRTLWLRFLWASSADEPAQGLAISHEEVDRILGSPEAMALAEAAFYAEDPDARELGPRINELDRQVADDDTWRALRQEFGLSEAEVDLLMLAVASEIDPTLRRVYGYLHDDANACTPTPWLASGIFQWSEAAPFGPDSALVSWRLAQPVDGLAQPWTVTAPWVADPHLVSWLLGGQHVDPSLGAAARLLPDAAIVGLPCLYPDVLDAAQEFVRAMLGGQVARDPLEIVLIGPPGSGKQILARQICASLGVDLLAADAQALFGDASPSVALDRSIRVIRSARLRGAVVYWRHLEAVDPQLWHAIHEQSAGASAGLTLVGAASAIAPPANDRVISHSFELPRLTRGMRSALWRHLSELPVPDPVANWLLTPREIAHAARVAPAGAQAVAEACRQALYQGPGEIFTPLPCPYTWEEIVLAPSVRRHLQELEEQARLRWAVYEEWGFERLCALGRGITALFAGPSGTGKTMAAQVLARSLGMDLYRVDLAGVMNKYIGETEKRLKQVFNACERANVLLLFDEADALFGQRTQVKDAHDRFANVEIDYLLQRMEQFDGIAILATNRKGDMDTAFLRRLRFIVDFMQPGPAERHRLWRIALPERAANGDELLADVDWDFLASRLTMTGADIKSAALGAAFLARAEGARIGMRQILYAARREMAKHGVVIRPGDWEG